MHGLIFELKERMNSRQDQPVKKIKQKSLIKFLTEVKSCSKGNTKPPEVFCILLMHQGGDQMHLKKGELNKRKTWISNKKKKRI